MLSSTADHLFWMARSIERAENTARMLDITYKMSLLKHATLEPAHEWSAVLSISGLYDVFSSKHGEPGAASVIRFMALDEANPASIYSSLKAARENARAVRGSITSEMWETLNATWLEIKSIAARGIPRDGVSDFFEWVKERSHLSRGITYGTMLRDEGFRFIRLGTFLERADNTMRILDVKYHVLLPSLHDVGGVVDYYQWSALLRSVSGFETYRRVYRDVITPRRVAELLILRADMPRSLHACVEEINLQILALNGPRSEELLRLSGRLYSELRFGRIEEIMAEGLHEYLTRCLLRLRTLGEAISTTYFWGDGDWAA
ncbi:MAG TPA: alpha-E domain-containing protein [Rhodocyclaceae bacterium]|nr:alpha-E domain-containing protein [Rhodocyclaceae bacterium]